jgi:hypothetical protein
MLRWMIFDGEITPYFTAGKIIPRASVGSTLASEGIDLYASMTERDEAIRQRWNAEFSPRLIGRQFSDIVEDDAIGGDDGEDHLYLVRETKGTTHLPDLRPERRKIMFGRSTSAMRWALIIASSQISRSFRPAGSDLQSEGNSSSALFESSPGYHAYFRRITDSLLGSRTVAGLVAPAHGRHALGRCEFRSRG